MLSYALYTVLSRPCWKQTIIGVSHGTLIKGLLNGVIFIDLKKAFYHIDHKIIYWVDQDALKWFKSYLTNRNDVT